MHFLQFFKDLSAFGFIFGKDEIPEYVDPVFIEKHVLGPAKADSFCAKLERQSRVTGAVSIGTYMEILDKGSGKSDKFE